MMKRLSAVALFLLGMSSVLSAQNEFPAPQPVANENVAMDFAQTSASSPRALRRDLMVPFSVASSATTFANSFRANSLADPGALVWPAAMATTAEPAFPAVPAPPVPSYDCSECENRWQLGLGVALVRFRSSVYSATAVGLNSSLAYFVKDWLGIEGAVTSAVAPAVFKAGEDVKYVGYGAGPKITLGHDRLDPWVHVLAGGMHIVPQTGGGGENGFEVLAGGGVDYSFVPQFAVRLEADYINSHAFSQSQNYGQATLGLVFHF
jgi:Outer membrane protein beta-barrel domain